MKYKKNADTLLFLLFFTTGQREKNIEKKKHYLWVQALRTGEKFLEYFTPISTES